MNKKFIYFLSLLIFIISFTSVAAAPNDFYYSNQWYLSKIKADKAWEKISKTPDITIAVIDSGIQINHPDLKANIWTNSREIENNKKDDDNNGFIDDKHGWDFVNNVPDPSPKFLDGWTESGVSHGTLIAGIIAAVGNNGQGIAGVTWDAKIMPLKAFSDKGEGRVSDIIRAIDYATNNGADIINLSFMNFDYSESLQAAIARAHRAGVIIVSAAGNEQSGESYNISDKAIYPACYDGNLSGENMVIGVAATDALDQKTTFSAYGDRCIDITAPGISFFGTIAKGANLNNPELLYDGYWSGTSMAAPLVSGALALIAQANPELSKREIVNILFASTDDISLLNPNYPNQLGNGRLNVNRAVEMAKEKLYSHLGVLLIKSDKESDKGISLRSVNGSLIKEMPANIFSGYDLIKAKDIDGDGESELIMGSAIGQESKIKIISASAKLKIEFLVYGADDKNGVNFAIGDLDGDGKQEIITSVKQNGNGKLKIFDLEGNLIREISAYDKNYKGEVKLAVGDIDGDGREEIVIAFASLRSDVRILSAAGKLIGAFPVFNTNFSGGLELEVANIDGLKNGSKAEIIVMPGAGRETEIMIFDNHANLLKKFSAFNRSYKLGASLSIGDINNDGISDIVVGAKSGASPHVRAFNASGIILESFYAWDQSFNEGVLPIALKIKN